MIALKIFKWIFGLISGALSVLLILYLAFKNEAWEIVTGEGQVVVGKIFGICLIAAWAVVGAMFLLFEFLHKRLDKQLNSPKDNDKNED